MPDIHIHRTHQLGLAKARQLAGRWAEEVEKKFDMVCTVKEGETSDTVVFKRIGASGTLKVGESHFELDARLGFLLGAFSKTIESEIERNLDQLLDKHAPPTACKAGMPSAAKLPGRTAASAVAGAKKARNLG